MSRPKAKASKMVGREAAAWRKREKTRRRLENEYGRQRAAFARQAYPDIEQKVREAAGVVPVEAEEQEQEQGEQMED